ncbi:Flp family type IVb pilin [Aestuariivirga litoralis]|uniref:Flp family type IVb pilin n=1 Tax=Aestuariivirga litoralis TaxID=2650924 RepID=UPI0018C48049|nr:Flp family type IVb pilin [Aestuariivirga litoralis]MBG1231409.1 Flp family type IVb pilin [Aestuariivirga litoralis]
MFRKFFADQRGVTAIEYVVIAAALGVGLVILMPGFSSQVAGQFSSLGSHIASGK